MELKIASEYSETSICSDLNALQSILNCLIENAIKFTDKGHIHILIDSFQKDDKKWARISIEDTGIGIDESKFETIFIPFRQGSEGLSRTHEGTGLGLALSKKYLEIIGGTIRIKSALGKGSTFIIEIPEQSPDCGS